MRAAVPAGGPPDVHHFDTTTEFYSRLGERLDTAEREICVTYIRECRPTGSPTTRPGAVSTRSCVHLAEHG